LLTLDSEEDGGAITSTLLQNVSVLAVGDVYTTAASTDDTAKKGAEKKVRNVTLMVTPEEANELQLGATQGTLALSLRGQNDNGNAEPTRATTDNLKGKHDSTPEVAATGADDSSLDALQREVDALRALIEQGGQPSTPELAVAGPVKIEKPSYLTIQLLRGTAMSEVRIRKPAKQN
ncbi:MAG TPA: RcpC/CpaB family pilus assembly protein, partial [Pirellulales bacterium]